MRDVILDRTHLEELGTEFEFKIMRYLGIKFPQAVFLHDLSIYCKRLDKETQIDLIMITDKEIYVIEAKNWVGHIEGTYNDSKWTGSSRARLLMTVFNPVDQNAIHIRTLRNALRCSGINPPQFHNLVVVPDGTAIKSPCKEVINLAKTFSVINQVESASKNKIDKSLFHKMIMEVCKS